MESNGTSLRQDCSAYGGDLPSPSLTAFHAKYYALDLTLSGGRGVDSLGEALTTAAVDLNPHQVQAALFALKSPLPQGVLLADEVGLGKTIEAGLVLCQLWAERKRKLLVICPATLRKQWQEELWSKFNLPAEILDAKRYRELQKIKVPFNIEGIIILSYQFAAKHADELREIAFDCCVLDEAHKLRNSHRMGNRVGQAIRFALNGKKKILLSATPLQNNLTELYGLATLLDDNFFGDLPTFRSRFVNAGSDLNALRERLKDICYRTLRKDAAPYVRYTKRLPLTISFEGSPRENNLYRDISSYLQDETSYAFPKKQRKILILLVRKLLASSPAALAVTLERIVERLEALKAQCTQNQPPLQSGEDWIGDILAAEYDTFWENDEEEDSYNSDKDEVTLAHETINLAKLESEIILVRDFCRRAHENTYLDSKTHSLTSALEQGWKKLAELGASQKAVIFTESRRTMEFLRLFLTENGYSGKVVCFSGGGKRSPIEESIFQRYCEDHPNEAASKEVLMRHALIEEFRERAQILITTEAGAEGINLQFCSMVINYDLPWNPQRVEQRIGRCHRYGQKNDVVVVNFLNTKNAADQRVFELLSSKLELFNGLFGATDDILGALDDAGLSVEQRIFNIFQQCHTDMEIQAAFDKLQDELSEQIRKQRESCEREVINNLDPQVLERLHFTQDWAEKTLPRKEREFWELSKYILRDHAYFDDSSLSFVLHSAPSPQIKAPAKYSFSKKQSDTADSIPYRPNSLLGEIVIASAKAIPTPPAEIIFDRTGHDRPIGALNNLASRSGWLRLDKLTLSSYESQEFLLFSAVDDMGKSVEPEVAASLFSLLGTECLHTDCPTCLAEKLAENAKLYAASTTQREAEKSEAFFKEESARIERWSRDKLAVAEKKISDAKAREREVKKAMRVPTTVDALQELEERLKSARLAVRNARRQRDACEDELDDKLDRIFEELRSRLIAKEKLEPVFETRWCMI